MSYIENLNLFITKLYLFRLYYVIIVTSHNIQRVMHALTQKHKKLQHSSNSNSQDSKSYFLKQTGNDF